MRTGSGEGCRTERRPGVGLVLGALVLLTAACGASEGSTPGNGQAVPETGVLARDTALERLAGELRPAVEKGAGLRFRRPPRLARSSREKLESFLAEQLSEELPPERAEAVTAAYARLGLLPDTLDLAGLLRSLYLEQVAGYYDPEVDTLFVREEVSAEVLRPVLVHELVHALQDQHTDLDSVMTARADANDGAMAAQAAVEGHATYVMLEWQLARATGRDVDLTQLPDLGGMLAGQDLGALSGMPELSQAPRLLRESLLFPYTGGLGFVQRVWRAAEDRPVPLGEDLPASTEQILHPGRYLASSPDVPTRVETPSVEGEGWREVHADGLGEFETRFFLQTFVEDSAAARDAAEGWDGDRYRLLRGPGGEALVWITVWDTDRDADAFAAAVRRAYRGRYGAGEGARGGPGAPDGAEGTIEASDREVRVVRTGADGRPVVRVTDAPAGVSLGGDLVRFRLGEPARTGPGGGR